MKLLVTLTVVFLVCLQASATDTATSDADAGTAKTENCTSCHNAVVSLKGRGADVIAGQTKAIRDGKKPHPHLPGLAELSNEDIADIAAYLDGI